MRAPQGNNPSFRKCSRTVSRAWSRYTETEVDALDACASCLRKVAACVKSFESDSTRRQLDAVEIACSNTNDTTNYNDIRQTRLDRQGGTKGCSHKHDAGSREFATAMTPSHSEMWRIMLTVRRQSGTSFVT